MSKYKEKAQFVDTRRSIYAQAESIVQLCGVPALVDILLEWADDAFHNEIFKNLCDEATIAAITIGKTECTACKIDQGPRA